MNKKYYFLLVLCAATIYIIWIFYGHEKRVLTRLFKTGIIKEKDKVELVYSSGITRDNWHIFKVFRSGVRVEGGYLFDPKNESDMQIIRRTIEDINSKANFGITINNSKFYGISEPGGYLVYLTVVEREEGDSIILMRVM
ncbi:MAG TPA: hypothetical protein PK490_18535 [Prosthecobacter sp.]|nr:hypothetical protein [Prosthecobacter sp.]